MRLVILVPDRIDQIEGRAKTLAVSQNLIIVIIVIADNADHLVAFSHFRISSSLTGKLADQVPNLFL
jgi:hypothetical protein